MTNLDSNVIMYADAIERCPSCNWDQLVTLRIEYPDETEIEWIGCLDCPATTPCPISRDDLIEVIGDYFNTDESPVFWPLGEERGKLKDDGRGTKLSKHKIGGVLGFAVTCQERYPGGKHGSIIVLDEFGYELAALRHSGKRALRLEHLEDIDTVTHHNGMLNLMQYVRGYLTALARNDAVQIDDRAFLMELSNLFSRNWFGRSAIAELYGSRWLSASRREAVERLVDRGWLRTQWRTNHAVQQIHYQLNDRVWDKINSRSSKNYRPVLR